jgi:dephospho-CoA kinase
MIIGITGTNGAGKGTVVDYLVQQRGFKHYSVRNFLVAEVLRRGLEPNRENITNTATDLRRQHGPTYVLESLLETAEKDTGNIGVESIRVIAEADLLRKHHALLLAVDADRKIRYERSVLRGSSTDKVSFEEFCRLEEVELTSTDPTKQNVLGVVALADYKLTNNGTPEELHAQIDRVLGEIEKN